MNTFTFSGKIDSAVLARKNVVTNSEYSEFSLFIDDRCVISCRAYGEPGATLFFNAKTGDRIEGVGRICATPFMTWIEIINVNFVDKKIEAHKPSEKVIEAFKVQIDYDNILDNIYNFVKKSYSKEEINKLLSSIVLAIVSTTDAAAQENSKSINSNNFEYFCSQFFVYDAKNGFELRKVFDLQKYVNAWMKNVKSFYFSNLY